MRDRHPARAHRALRAGVEGATPVLALHGWLDNAASFVPLARELDGLDLVAVDLPGHGRSAHRHRRRLFVLRHGHGVVLDIADALGWERFALLGHSMGAGIGSLLAAACPQRVSRFLAIEALGALAEAPERTHSADARGGGRGARVAEEDAAGVPRSGTGDPRADAGERAERTGGAAAGGARHARGRRRLRVEQRSAPDAVRTRRSRAWPKRRCSTVAGIECPVRLIHADPAQPYSARSGARAHAAALRDGGGIVIRGGHHLTTWSSRTMSGRGDRRFLRSLNSRRGFALTRFRSSTSPRAREREDPENYCFGIASW